MPEPSRSDRRRGAASVALALVLGLAVAVPAAAHAVPALAAQAPAATNAPQATPVPAATPAAGVATPPSDPLTLRSPLCAPAARAALDAAEQRACASGGSPLSGAPTTHYAFDIDWNPSIAHPADVAVKSVYTLLDMLWLALLFAVRGVLTLLDWAFTLDPFQLGTLGGLQQALGRFFAVVDAGYLSAVIAALGLWGIWSGVVRRRGAETAGGLALAVAMLVVAVAIVHAPERTVGVVARLANDAAMGLMAAPSHGVGAAPVATYGQAVDGLFDDIVRRPWCALQFRTQRFCAGAAERGAVAAALAAARDDQPAGVSPGAGVSRGELWLAFAPASAPRAALHDYYGGHDGGKVGALGVTIVDTGIGDTAGHDPGEVAIQGAAGSLVRLPLLLLVVVGVLGALLVVGWIMLRLLDQAATGFVLLLLTPVALLLVAFGETGRAAFARWGLGLLGALVSKVVYAVLLGVVVLAARLLTGSAGAGDWMLAWLLQTAFWWSVFLKRARLIGYLTVVPAFDGAHGGGRGLGGALLAWRAFGAAGAAHDAVRGRALRSRVARSEGVRAAARESLDERAEQRAGGHERDIADAFARDALLDAALDTLGSGGEPPARADGDAADASARAAGPGAEWALGGDRGSPPDAGRAPAQPATAGSGVTRQAPSRADAGEPRTVPAPARAGGAWPPPSRGGRDTGPGGEPRAARRERLDQLRRELDLPAHDPRHAWRVGLSPDALLRQRDEDPAAYRASLAAVHGQLAADRALMRALPSDPRTPPRPSIEREAAGHLDGERLRELRRQEKARLRHERDRRRYLYR